MEIKIDFTHFYEALKRYADKADEQGVTLKDILIEYREDLDAPVACFFGEKDGKKMDGAFMLKVSTT